MYRFVTAIDGNERLKDAHFHTRLVFNLRVMKKIITIDLFGRNKLKEVLALMFLVVFQYNNIKKKFL